MLNLKFLFVLVFSFSCLFNLQAQSITGNWKGKSYVTGEEADTIFNYIEINAGKTPNKFTGTSVSIQENSNGSRFFGKAAFTGFYDIKSKKFILKEITLIEGPSFALLDKFTLWFSNGKLNELKGNVECYAGQEGFVPGFNRKRIISLVRTTEPLPENEKKIKSSKK